MRRLLFLIALLSAGSVVVAEVDSDALRELNSIRRGLPNGDQIQTLRVKNSGTIGGSLTVTGDIVVDDLTLGDDLDVAGDVTAAGGIRATGTLAAVNAATVGGTLRATGVATFGNAVNATGTITAINAAVVGTTLTVTNGATVGGTLRATGVATFGAAVNATGTVTAINAAVVGTTLTVTNGVTAGAVTVPGASLTLTGSGTNVVGTAAGLLDGEKIADGTIDDDSIDFADVTGADLTLTDVGALTTLGATTLGGTTVAITNDATVAGTLGVTGALTAGSLSGSLPETDVDWMATMITDAVTNGEAISLGDYVIKSLTSAEGVTSTVAAPSAGSTIGRLVTLFNDSTNLIVISMGSTVFSKDTEVSLSNEYDSVTITKYDADHWLLINKHLP